MSAFLNLLGTLKTALSDAGVAVVNPFAPTPLEPRNPARYLVVGLGEISGAAPEATADGTVYPLETELSLSLYDAPDADAQEMIACLEDEILGAVFDAGFSPVRLRLSPPVYDRASDKLLLRAVLTLGYGYRREAQT